MRNEQTRNTKRTVNECFLNEQEMNELQINEWQINEEEEEEKKKKKKKKVGENNGQLRFVRHPGWRMQARLDQHNYL